MVHLRSQPTYKEWKASSIVRGYPAGILFPAYLQGMESELERLPLLRGLKFPAYLQGMESIGKFIGRNGN